MKHHMREDHPALDMVDGLKLRDSLMDQVNMLKSPQVNQEQMATNMGNRFKNSLLEAFDIYAQMHTENEENHRPYQLV